jgi:septum site-determining protein MinC
LLVRVLAGLLLSVWQNSVRLPRFLNQRSHIAPDIPKSRNMIREEPAFKIKNANLPLFVLHVNTTDLELLKNELATRFAQSPDFFANTPMAIGLAAIADAEVTPDLAGLVSFVGSHGIRVAGVLGGSADQRENAVQAGLALFPDIAARPAPAPEPVVEAQEQVEPEVIETPVEEAPQATPLVRPTMVIDKPVRTGQRIYAEGADLVVLASVNAGAELIADGNIHIYAPLRGKAIAGARGNENARIFVQRLEAELLSIAGCFRVFEDGIPEDVRGKPTQISLDGSRLVFQPLSS